MTFWVVVAVEPELLHGAVKEVEGQLLLNWMTQTERARARARTLSVGPVRARQRPCAGALQALPWRFMRRKRAAVR